MVGFDADDTLWRSQDYFDAAQLEFERLIAPHVDLEAPGTRQRLYQIESRNIGVFGYGVKGMVLSMIEAAVQLTGGRIPSNDIHRIVELGKELLRHPVELLPGIREAVQEVARDFDVVLITKGDLFHQEAKVRQSGLADVFRRIEVVSEKDPATYARLLEEFELPAGGFIMVGNSMRSDIAPVLALGGWAVHVPYHTTWIHEDTAAAGDTTRLRSVREAAGVPAAVASIAAACPPMAPGARQNRS